MQVVWRLGSERVGIGNVRWHSRRSHFFGTTVHDERRTVVRNCSHGWVRRGSTKIPRDGLGRPSSAPWLHWVWERASTGAILVPKLNFQSGSDCVHTLATEYASSPAPKNRPPALPTRAFDLSCSEARARPACNVCNPSAVESFLRRRVLEFGGRRPHHATEEGTACQRAACRSAGAAAALPKLGHVLVHSFQARAGSLARSWGGTADMPPSREPMGRFMREFRCCCCSLTHRHGVGSPHAAAPWPEEQCMQHPEDPVRQAPGRWLSVRHIPTRIARLPSATVLPRGT